MNNHNNHSGKQIATLVLGVGNILLKDEGVGVRVIERMRRLKLPPGVRLMDGGTGGLDLLELFGQAHRVIVVDAVRGGGEPGAIYRFHADAIDVKTARISSLHEVNLYEVLNIARGLGESPGEVVIIGIEPKEIELDLELTPEVASRVDRLVELVLEELDRGDSASK